MAGFFKEAERVVKEISDSGLDVALFYYGIDLTLHRQQPDVYTRVFGSDADSRTETVCEFVGIVVPDDFFVASGSRAGSFEEGILYTKFEEVKVGDIISINSSDSKSRRYKVEKQTSLGTQDSVFKRFILSSIAD